MLFTLNLATRLTGALIIVSLQLACPLVVRDQLGYCCCSSKEKSMNVSFAAVLRPSTNRGMSLECFVSFESRKIPFWLELYISSTYFAGLTRTVTVNCRWK